MTTRIQISIFRMHVMTTFECITFTVSHFSNRVSLVNESVVISHGHLLGIVVLVLVITSQAALL